MAHPPGRGWFEAVVDLDPARATVTPLLGTYKNESENGMLNVSGDQAWIVNEGRIHRYDLANLDEPQQVFQLPQELTRGRKVFRTVTDLTMTSDGRHFVLDSHIGNQYHIGTVEVASGTYRELASFGNNHHHTICSRHDPNLFLINRRALD